MPLAREEALAVAVPQLGLLQRSATIEFGLLSETRCLLTAEARYQQVGYSSQPSPHTEGIGMPVPHSWGAFPERYD